MKEIKLSKEGKKYKGLYVALVDDEDFERVNQFRWSVVIGENNTYAVRNISTDEGKGKQYLHSFILDIKTSYDNQIDHFDHRGLNCQKNNMRACTVIQNQRNQRPHKKGTSIYKGVSWYKPYNKWKAKIINNKVDVFLGYFHDEIDAAKAYDLKAKEFFGEYAYLNFHD